MIFYTPPCVSAAGYLANTEKTTIGCLKKVASV